MARYDRRQIQRVRFAVESTFGTDLTSDVANNFYDLRHMGTAIMPDTLVEKDMTVRQRFLQERGVVIGPKRGTVAIESYLTGTNEALAASTSPTKTPQSRFLEALMGGYSSGQGSAVVALPSPTTTGCTVTTGHGSRFVEGTIASVEVSGVYYPVLITDVSTDALTWWPALPSAPSTGDDVLNAQSLYIDETDESWLQILGESAIDRGNIYLLRGCQGDLSFKLERDGLLTWSSSLSGARRNHDDEITTPQGGSALAAATYSGTRPIFGTSGGFHFGPSASSTRNLVRVSEFSINPGIAWDQVPDHAGLEGIGEWERQIPEMTVEMTVLINASSGAHEAYLDAFEAETEYGLLWWVGSTGGNGVSIACPTMQIQAAPEPVEAVNGHEALKLSLLMKESNLTGAVATAAQVSPMVLGCF